MISYVFQLSYVELYLYRVPAIIHMSSQKNCIRNKERSYDTYVNIYILPSFNNIYIYCLFYFLRNIICICRSVFILALFLAFAKYQIYTYSHFKFQKYILLQPQKTSALLLNILNIYIKGITFYFMHSY